MRENLRSNSFLVPAIKTKQIRDSRKYSYFSYPWTEEISFGVGCLKFQGSSRICRVPTESETPNKCSLGDTIQGFNSETLEVVTFCTTLGSWVFSSKSHTSIFPSWVPTKKIPGRDGDQTPAVYFLSFVWTAKRGWSPTSFSPSFQIAKDQPPTLRTTSSKNGLRARLAIGPEWWLPLLGL